MYKKKKKKKKDKKRHKSFTVPTMFLIDMIEKYYISVISGVVSTRVQLFAAN